MSSRFIYLYLFKHSLKVHASRVACFTHFNCHNPDHYHCTSSAELCYTAIIPWREEEGKKKTTTNTNKTQFSSWPSSRLLPHPFARAWSWQAGLPQPRICILFSRQCRHAGLAETGVYKVMPSNCFTWLCSLWSPSFFKLLFPTTSFLIANCTTVYLCILHTHRKASAKTSTPKKSSWVNWGRLQDLLRNEAH